MANEKSYQRFKTWALWVVLPVSIALLVVALVIACWTSISIENFCLFLLFAAPVVVQIIGLRSLDLKFESAQKILSKGSSRNQHSRIAAEALVLYSRCYVWTMVVCLWSYNALWVAYAWGRHHYDWENSKQYISAQSNVGDIGRIVLIVLSVLALVAVTALLFMVMWMTRAAISDEAPSETQETQSKSSNLFLLRLGASQAPFLTLLFFLTVFLGVSYLFGFAFAFHDKTKTSKEPGLVMRNLIIPDAALKGNPMPTPTESPIATFMFGDATALPSRDIDGSQELTDAITKITQKTENDNPIRVLVIGGADLRKVKRVAYLSNYELAEARALYVKTAILARLSGEGYVNVLRNVEVSCIPRPSEITTAFKEEPIDQRMVRVFVEQNFESPTSLLVRHLRANRPKPLTLMDYIYFANYTITTTGYGDIVPNTVYAKFICSFANIAEVFFLVVFFNTLLSLLGRRSTEATSHKVESVEKQLKLIATQINELHTMHGPRGGRNT